MSKPQPQGSLLFHLCGSGSELFNISELERVPKGKYVRPVLYQGTHKRYNLVDGGKLTVGTALLKFR
jgi:hypothetical protein